MTDPFAPIPEHPVRPEDERPDMERKGKKIPLSGEGVKKKRHADYESMSRDLWRGRGYHYDKVSFTQPYTGKSHDLYGFADAMATGNGEAVLVQTTSHKAKSAHVSKWLRDDWAVFGGHRFPILETMVRLIAVPGVRIVLCCWHQPGGHGTKWLCEETVIDESFLYEAQSRRERSAG